MKKTKLIVLIAFFLGILLLPNATNARTSNLAEEYLAKIQVVENEDEGTCTYQAKSISYETLFESKFKTYEEFVNWHDPSYGFSEEDFRRMYEDHIKWEKHEVMITANDFSYIPEMLTKQIEIMHQLNDDGTITFTLDLYNPETGENERGEKTCYIEYAETDAKVLEKAKKYVSKISDNYIVYGLNALSAVYHYGEFDIFKGPKSLVYRYPELKKVLSNKEFEFDVDYIVGCGGTPVTGGCELSAAIRKDGITYATKRIMLSENVVIPVDKNAAGTPYEKAVKRIKDHFGEKNVTIELNPESPDIMDMDEEETSPEANDLFGTKDVEYIGYRANILLNGKRATIVIIEVEKKLIDKYEVRAKHNQTGVNVYTESPDVPIDATIEVENVKDKDYVKKAIHELKHNLLTAFNIDLLKTTTGVKINEIEKGIEVYIPINNKNIGDVLLVHHIKEDGTLGDKFEGEVVELEGNKYVKFTTTHFSTYAVLEDTTEKSTENNPETSDSIKTVIIILGLSLMTLIISIIRTRELKQKN